MINFCRIPFEARLDYHEGRADSKTTQLVKRHVAEGCHACTRDLEWIAEFMPTLQGVLQHAELRVSDWAISRAQQIMHREPPTPSAVQRLVTTAHLLFDSRSLNRGLATARDAADGSVHVVYRTELADVDVWQEQVGPGRWYVTGQALGLSGTDMEPPQAASLISSKFGPSEAALEDSEFSFESVNAGNYSLRLRWDALEIDVDDLAVGLTEVL